MWWRVWIPSWRFFDRNAAVVRLEVWRADGWRPALGSPPRRRWWSLFFNPAGNSYLAQRNQLDRAAAGSRADLTEIARREGRFRLLVGDEVVAEGQP